MTTRKPAWEPAVEGAAVVTLGEPTVAEVRLLADADASQHALMTGRGWPAVTTMLEATCTSASTPVEGSLLVVLPPNVTHLRVHVLAKGSGSLRITSPDDAEGTLLHLADQGNGLDSVVESSYLDDAAVDGARHLLAELTVGWVASVVELTWSLLASEATSPSVTIVSLALAPVHVPATI